MAFQIGDKVKIKSTGGTGHVLRADDQNFILVHEESATKVQNSAYYEAKDLTKISADEFPVGSSNVSYTKLIQNVDTKGAGEH